MNTNDYISVVLPCYNEGEMIYDNIKKTVEIIQTITERFEIVCVNDGSEDNTEAELLKAEKKYNNVKCISYSKNAGKGHALQVGTAAAKGDYIAFVDSDLELSPIFLKRYLEIMKEQEADAVIGSKLHPESKIDYPKIRKVLSLGYYVLLKILFRLKVKDTQTGLKVFKADIIKEVMPKIIVKGYAFDIEVLAIINRKGYKIVDAPIELVFSRENVRGRIRMKDIWKMFMDTCSIFYRVEVKKVYD